MHILVTGGAGYIGSITTRHLLDAGHSCTVIDTLENGHRWAVDARARLIEGSVGDRTTIAAALTGVDCVMHLAGYIEVAESKLHPEKYFANNVDAAHVMLDAMVEAGVGKIVFSSTAAVYGEPTYVPIDEQAPTLPINPYGESKLAFEKLLDAYTDKITSIRFRYFNVAGAMPDASLGEAHSPETHIIPNVIEALLHEKSDFKIFGDDYPTKDGTCVRDYIHVLDLAQAHRLAIEALGRNEAGGVYNLGNGNGFSNLTIFETCMDEMHHHVPVQMAPRRPGDPAVLIASSLKARERFGWSPDYHSIHDMVKHALAWHQRRGTLMEKAEL